MEREISGRQRPRLLTWAITVGILGILSLVFSAMVFITKDPTWRLPTVGGGIEQYSAIGWFYFPWIAGSALVAVSVSLLLHRTVLIRNPRASTLFVILADLLTLPVGFCLYLAGAFWFTFWF